MDLKSNRCLSLNICLLIFISTLLQPTNGDSSLENERHKRTIGFLLRELANAFQSPQQPAPTVSSFQPQRPIKQKKRPPKPAKSDIPLPNNPKPEKTFLQPAVTTESAEVQLLSLVEPPITAAPLQIPPTPENPILTSHQGNLPSNIPENQQNPLFVPANPFEKMVPPPGHHPLMPLKAQIFFIPFQNNQEPTHPQPKTSDPHFNYEAEIYFHSPQNLIYPPTHSARYSPTNGWHDIDEIISRTTQKASKYTNSPVENLTQPDYHQLNYQKLEGLSPHTDSKLGTLVQNVPPENGHENSVPPSRRIDQSLDQQQPIDRPTFIPHREFRNENDFYNEHGSSQSIQYQYLQSPPEEMPSSQQNIPEANSYVDIHSPQGYTYQGSNPEQQSYSSEFQQGFGYRRNAIPQYSPNYDDQMGYEHYPTKIGRLPEYLTWK